MRPVAFGLLLIAAAVAPAADPPSDADAERLKDQAVAHYQQGQIREAVGKLRDALKIREQLYPPATFPEGHPKLAADLHDLGFLLYHGGAHAQALPLYEKSLAMRRRFTRPDKFPEGASELGEVMHNLAWLLRDLGRFNDARPLAEESLALRDRLFPKEKFPDGHERHIPSLMLLADVIREQGTPAKAEPYVERALKTCERLYPKAKFPDGHPAHAVTLQTAAKVSNDVGAFDECEERLRAALAMKQKLYPKDRFPSGHPNLAAARSDLAATLNVSGHGFEALQEIRAAAQMYRALFPPDRFPAGHPDLLACLINQAEIERDQSDFVSSVLHAEEAMAMARRLFPADRYRDGHPLLAACIVRYGAVLSSAGERKKAASVLREALAMGRKLYPPARFADGHLFVARAESNLAVTLAAEGEFGESVTLAESSLAMCRRLFPPERHPRGHRDIAQSLSVLSICLMQTGQPQKALAAAEQRVRMLRDVYPAERHPNGHQETARALLVWADVAEAVGDQSTALQAARDAVAMMKKLYTPERFPKGTDDLARAWNRLGLVLMRFGEFAAAREPLERAVAIRESLFPADTHPRGHLNFASSIHNLGCQAREVGDLERAEQWLRRGLAMRQSLCPSSAYPDGHMVIVESLTQLGELDVRRGRTADAAAMLREAATMQQRVIQRSLRRLSEHEALALLKSAPPVRDRYMCASRDLPTESAAAYERVWHSKAAVARLLAERRVLARADAGLQAELDNLRSLSRQMENMTLQPAADDGRRLVELASRRDQLERRIADRLPAAATSSTPDNLRKTLPRGAVFIDLLAYRCSDANRAAAYAAFIVAPDRPVVRVELGPAAPIDAAVRGWREAIESGRPETAAQQLRRLVWEPMAGELPRDAATVFISPDGDLARLPWAALPIDDARVLIERFAVAVVPHGTLLADPSAEPGNGADRSLLVGEVDYAGSEWPALPGTARELNAVKPLAGAGAIILNHDSATIPRLTDELPKARFAHLATHGFFDQAALRSEQLRAETAFRRRRFGDDASESFARNPFAYSGLVLSKGEPMTALSIVGLPLDGLRLAVLSACETGLGELTGGEGVFGLVRAFHLAGCPNVVASLWKVSDAATAALMAKFYHELWVNKKPPLAALREAQLTIYRHPELIPDLAGERGAPKLKQAVAAKAGEPSRVSGRVADTKQWAAFVLSGVGK